MSLVNVRKHVEDKQADDRRTLVLRFNNFLNNTGITEERIQGLSFDDGEYCIFMEESQISEIESDGSFMGGLQFRPSSSYFYIRSWYYDWRGIFLMASISNEGNCDVTREAIGLRLQKVDYYFWRLFKKPNFGQLALPEPSSQLRQLDNGEPKV